MPNGKEEPHLAKVQDISGRPTLCSLTREGNNQHGLLLYIFHMISALFSIMLIF